MIHSMILRATIKVPKHHVRKAIEILEKMGYSVYTDGDFRLNISYETPKAIQEIQKELYCGGVSVLELSEYRAAAIP